MARTGRPKAGLTLTDQEEETLQRWARRPKSAQQLALRSKIVLACAAGKDNKAVAAELAVHQVTVGKWRSRFLASRLEGLTDEDRPGRPRTISDEKVEEVIVKALEQPPPDNDSHWSTRSMARVTGMSQTAICRIWRAFELKPHREQTWKLSADPQFIEKVRDVVGLYMDPPEHALVLCVDEKSQIQAIDRTAPCLPVLPHHPGPAQPRLCPQRHHQPVRRPRHGDRRDHFLAAPTGTAVTLDKLRVYRLRDVSIDRAAIHITLNNGTIAFTGDVAGRVTGAFFEGDGEILLSPPNQYERASMALFTGAAILEERFVTAYFRFNDDTFAELLRRWCPSITGRRSSRSGMRPPAI